MSIAAEVKRIIAEEADGLLRAVHHIAAEVEDLAGRAPGAPRADANSIETKLAAAVDAKVQPFLDDLQKAFAGKMSEFEVAIAELQGKVNELTAPTHDGAALPAPAASEQAEPAAS